MSKIVFVFAALLSVSSLLSAEEYVTRSEYEALSRKVEALQLEVRSLQKVQVSTLSEEALAAMPDEVKDSPALIEQVVDAMHSREQAINFPWMDTAKWELLKKGMSPDAVVDVLGSPTLNEPSMHKRVDFVYTYEGRQPSTGKRIFGVVRFYKSKAIEIEFPELD